MTNLLPYVWIAVAILLMAGVFFLYVRMGNRRPAKPKIPPIQPLSPEQELSSLGILEIKPKAKTAAPAAATEEVEEKAAAAPPPPEKPSTAPYLKHPTPEPAAEEAELPAAKPEPEAAPMATSMPTLAESLSSGAPPALKEMLQAVRATAGAHSVAFVKRLEPGRYWIECMVSESEDAQVEGSFEMDGELDEAAQNASTVVVFDVGSAYVPLEGLGYYSGTVGVRQFAIAPVRIPDNDTAYALILDALAWTDLDDPWQRLMIGQFTTLIGTLLASPAPAAETSGQGPRVRTRREIIAEEMEQARTEEQPLALALIHLNRAEDVADAGEEAVGEAEQVLASHIGEATPDSRMERFGELTYGVFRSEEVAEVEAWAVRLEDNLQEMEGLLTGGVSIGIALLRDRHQTPDDFREDAHAALREAFETGTCTIIE